MKKENIVREISLFAAVKYSALFLYGVLYLIILRYLGPARYGVWVIFNSILYGIRLIGLGAPEGMVRQVAYYSSHNRKEYVCDLQQTAFWWGLCLSLCVAFFLFGISFFSFAKDYQIEFILCGGAFLMSYISFFVCQKLKSENRINALSYYSLAGILLACILYITLMYYFAVKGLLLAVIIQTSVLFLITWHKKIIIFEGRICPNALKELLTFGFPMMLLFVSFYLMTHISNVLVFSFLGKKAAGFYGVATVLSRAILYFPSSVAIVLFPKIMATYGKVQTFEAIEEFYLKPIRFLMFSAPFFIGVICLVLPIPLYYFVPQYMDALPTIRILAFGTSASVFLLLATYMVIAFNRQIWYCLMSIILLVLVTIFDLLAIVFGYGIEGVAYSTSAVFLLQSVIWNAGVLRQLGYSITGRIRMLVKMHVPLIYCVLIMIPIIVFMPMVGNLFLSVSIRLFIFSILMLPCMMKMWRYKDGMLFENYVHPRTERCFS